MVRDGSGSFFWYCPIVMFSSCEFSLRLLPHHLCHCAGTARLSWYSGLLPSKDFSPLSLSVFSGTFISKQKNYYYFFFSFHSLFFCLWNFLRSALLLLQNKISWRKKEKILYFRKGQKKKVRGYFKIRDYICCTIHKCNQTPSLKTYRSRVIKEFNSSFFAKEIKTVFHFTYIIVSTQIGGKSTIDEIINNADR